MNPWPADRDPRMTASDLLAKRIFRVYWPIFFWTCMALIVAILAVAFWRVA